MNIWDILEIDQTVDTSKIKKAYAKKLKIHHPEDDPNGYQKLREAYDAALKYSKYNLKRDLIIDDEDDILEDFIPETLNKNIYTPPPINLLGDFNLAPPSIEQLNNEFINRIKTLYNDFFTRIDIKNWEILLDCDVMWDIHNSKDLNIKMLEFLSDHHQLPQNIWKLLEFNFNFSEMEGLFNSPFSWLIKYIVKQLKQTVCLNFLNLKEINSVDYETYFIYREQALDALTENSLNDATMYIDLAKDIYTEDPDLLRMEVEYCLRTQYQTESLPILNHLLSIKPDDLIGLFCRAEIYYDSFKFDLAIEDYCRIQTFYPENHKLPFLMAKCYLKLGNSEKAKEYLQKSLLLTPSDADVKSYFPQVNKMIKNKLVLDLKKNRGNNILKLQLASIKKEIKFEKEAAKKRIVKAPISKLNSWLRISYIIFAFSFVLLAIYIGFDNKITPAASNDIKTTVDTETTQDDIIDLNKVNIDQIPDGVKNVKGTFTNIRCFKLFVKNEDNKYSVLCIGTINGKQLLFTASIFVTYKYKDTKQLVFKGTINYGPSSDFQSAVLDELRKLNKPVNNVIPGKYVILSD